MRVLEQFQLSNGELIVNVTDHDDLSEVTRELANTWEWDSFQIEWDEEGNGEWLCLIAARRREQTVPKAA